MGKTKRKKYNNTLAREHRNVYEQTNFYSNGTYDLFRSGNGNRFQQNSRSQNYALSLPQNYGNFRNQNYGTARSQNYGNSRGQNYVTYRRFGQNYPVLSQLKFFEKNKRKSRASSPVLGSQEYMEKKIEQTSAIIMRQLLNPEENCTVSDSRANEVVEKKLESPKVNKSKKKLKKNSSPNKNKKKALSYNVEEIQERIMSHLTNLNDGRRKNLINSNESGYDVAIQQIVKQKRLEISRALRNICSESNKTKESSDLINSFIPDMGIKIEELPQDVIEELRNTLNFEVDCDNIDGFGSDLDTGTSSAKDNMLLNMLDTAIEELDSNKNSSVVDITMDSSVDSVTNPETKCVDDFTSDLNLEDMHCNKMEIENSTENSGLEMQLDKDTIKIEPVEAESIPSELEKIHSQPESTPSGLENIHSPLESTPSELENIRSQPDSIPSDEKQQSKVDSSQTNDENMSEENLDDTVIKLENHDIDSSIRETIPSSSFGTDNQTSGCETINVSTQTDKEVITTEVQLKNNFSERPKNLAEAVSQMLEIDDWISRLTKYRQKLFTGFFQGESIKNENDAPPNETVDGNVAKKRKLEEGNVISTTHGPDVTNEKVESRESNSGFEEITVDDILVAVKSETNVLDFQEVEEVMLVIKIVEDKLVAGTESGKVFVCSLQDGHYLRILQVSKLPITSLLFETEEQSGRIHMYIGTLLNSLLVYDFHNYEFWKSVAVEEAVMCMDSKWGYVFAGCKGGWLLRYSINKGAFEYQDKFSDGSILVVKATLEGARRILLIVAQESPICIRDAMTGLHLRVMQDDMLSTVHSLIFEKNLVYCCTTDSRVSVFSFHEGRLIKSIRVEGSAGKGCMKIEGGLFFISCHMENIHVYNIETYTLVDTIKGPGGIVSSMEIVNDQVVVGTMSSRFKSIPIPYHILKLK